MTYVRRRYPQFRLGIEEAVAVAPSRFELIAEMFLEWAVQALGPEAIEQSVDAFVHFTTDVNLAQARYERTGRYEHQSFKEAYARHYSQDHQMRDYLWGIYVANFLWAPHMEICLFYRDRFLRRLPDDSEIVEIAPGHGGWGVWALDVLPRATLRGYDISPSSIEIAASVARAAGVNDRASYEERDALDLKQMGKDCADVAICSFLVEHLERPEKLFGVITHLLRRGGRAFITGALTAAQVDHIYEFRRESELVCMAEAHGLRVVEMLSANPKRLLPGARFVPRSIAMLAEKTVETLTNGRERSTYGTEESVQRV